MSKQNGTRKGGWQQKQRIKSFLIWPDLMLAHILIFYYYAVNREIFWSCYVKAHTHTRVSFQTYCKTYFFQTINTYCIIAQPAYWDSWAKFSKAHKRNCIEKLGTNTHSHTYRHRHKRICAKKRGSCSSNSITTITRNKNNKNHNDCNRKMVASRFRFIAVACGTQIQPWLSHYSMLEVLLLCFLRVYVFCAVLVLKLELQLGLVRVCFYRFIVLSPSV